MAVRRPRRAHVRPLTFGIQAKHVGDALATDVNDVRSRVTRRSISTRASTSTDDPRQEGATFQLNVINLFNEHYFGNLSTQINAFGLGNSAPRFTPGPTRAVTGTLTIGF